MESKSGLEQYLDNVCGEVKAKKMHAEIRSELSSHLEDLMIEHESLGASQAEAEVLAIAQMGDPKAVGKDLHHIHKPRTPWGLLGALLLFSAIGLLGMGSVDANPLETRIHESLLYRQSVFMLLGIMLMTLLYFCDFRRLQKLSWLLYIFSIAGIVASLKWGLYVNGSRTYFLAFGGIVINLVSYSPYIVLVALAGIFSKFKADGKLGTKRNLLPELFILLGPAAAYIIAGPIPVLLLYLVCSLILYTWLSGVWLRSTLIGGFFLAAGLRYAWNNQQMRDRILGAINYNINPESSGFVYKTLNEVIASAGWSGHGFGAEFERLPYAYSEMLPAYLVYCFGWGGGLVLLGITLWFLIKLFSSIQAVKDYYGKSVIMALSLILAMGLFYGLLVLSGKMILTSIPFPFMSYGGHVLIEYVALGLLMGIYRRKDITPAEHESRTIRGEL
ncbi:FtsW/RodA/SpoVE family cell cycle protein [Paenibacillus sp. FSL M7-1046]|uniref:FtsW/RodA/SpoVE family cell cycle protein n=1 Tax=Paenibacillus sp. FSL M7-1046 TaxID=2975315 RepID=UPI0030F54CA8